MADWDDALWPAADSAPTRADRRGGPYATHNPDLLMERPLTLAADVSELAGRVEASVRRLGELPGSRGLEGLARFLLRSEAIASSRIEGLQVSPQAGRPGRGRRGGVPYCRERQPHREEGRGEHQCLQRATHEFADAERLSVAGVEGLQTLLLADEPHLHGVRDVQNWIGGSDYHPLPTEACDSSWSAEVTAIRRRLRGRRRRGSVF